MPFLQHTHGGRSKVKPPEFAIEDIEDAYTYYVLILKIPEDVFWFADLAFLRGVVDNKAAYDGWFNYTLQKEQDKD